MTPFRRTLVALGVVAAIAVAVLLWLRRGTGLDAPRSDPTAAGGARPGGATGANGRPVLQPTDPTPPTSARGGGATADTRIHTTDTGRIVRDHRPGLNEHPTLFPAPLPPEQRTLNPNVTAALYQQLRPMVKACAGDVPARDRGAEPMVMVSLTVDIAGGSLTATDVNAGSMDVSDGSRERLATCVRERAAGLSMTTADEPDRSSYVVQFPMRLR